MQQISKIYLFIKLYMFRASSVPFIMSYLLYTRPLWESNQYFPTVQAILNAEWAIPTRKTKLLTDCDVSTTPKAIYALSQLGRLALQMVQGFPCIACEKVCLGWTIDDKSGGEMLLLTSHSYCHCRGCRIRVIRVTILSKEEHFQTIILIIVIYLFIY